MNTVIVSDRRPISGATGLGSLLNDLAFLPPLHLSPMVLLLAGAGAWLAVSHHRVSTWLDWPAMAFCFGVAGGLALLPAETLVVALTLIHGHYTLLSR